jgi:hypothetical protein
VYVHISNSSSRHRFKSFFCAVLRAVVTCNLGGFWVHSYDCGCNNTCGNYRCAVATIADNALILQPLRYTATLLCVYVVAFAYALSALNAAGAGVKIATRTTSTASETTLVLRAKALDLERTSQRLPLIFTTSHSSAHSCSDCVTAL